MKKIEKTKFRPLNELENGKTYPGIMIIRIEDGLFFGNVGSFRDALRRLEMFGSLEVHPGEEPVAEISEKLRLIVLDMSSVNDIDAT